MHQRLAVALAEIELDHSLERIEVIDVGEDEAVGLVELEIGAVDPMRVVGRPALAASPFAADAVIDLAMREPIALWPVPADHVLGVFPELPDQSKGRVALPVELKHFVGRVAAGLSACRHRAS